MTNSLLRRTGFILILTLVFIAGYELSVKHYSTPLTSHLTIDAVPSGSTVKLDQKSVGTGTIAVTSGLHTVTVSQNGFNSKTQTITTYKGQTGYLAFVLNSNSSSTRNWYDQHPNDKTLEQGFASHEATYESQISLYLNPFLKYLPLVYGDGQGGVVNVSQGVSLLAGGQPAIFVSASSPQSRQSVLTLIRSRGYNPANMDIVFSNATYVLSDGE